MATSVKHSGFKRLIDRDPTLAILVGGAEVLTFRKDSTGNYGAMKIGTAYEASASIIDGYGISLATGYGAALSNRLYGLDINADTGSTDVTGDTMVGAIRGRTVIGTTQTNASIYGVHGNIDVGASKNIISNYAGVYGVVDFYGNTTIAGSVSHVAGGFFTIWNEGTTTLNSAGGTLTGVTAILNGNVSTNTAGVNAAFLARGQSAWAYGLYLTASKVTTGIYIGTCTTGINIEGTVTLALGIGTTAALTTVSTGVNAVKVQSNFTGLTTTSHLANFFVSQYTAAGTGSLRTVVGQVDLSGTQTTANTAQYLVGVHGRAKVSGTAYNTALFVTGVMGQILDGGGTWTAANHVSSIWGDWQSNDAITGASSTELLYLSNNANSETGNPSDVMYVYAPRMTNFIQFSGVYTTAGGMCAASSTAGTMTNTLRCSVNGTTRYLHFFDA